MRFWRSFVAVLPVFFLASFVVQAAELAVKTPDPYRGYEIRISGQSHNIEPTADEHGHIGIAGSVLFPKVDAGLTGITSLWIPRAHLGSSIDLGGKTSFAYGGVTWTLPIFETYQFSFDFGGALNNGQPHGGDGYVTMGCHATFRESASIGRSITEHISLSAMIEHFSNAHLCQENTGITNVGLMVGYKF